MARKTSRGSSPGDSPGEIETDLAVKLLMDQTSWTSLSLLRRAKDLDQDAWRELVATYGDRIYGWCDVAGLPGRMTPRTSPRKSLPQSPAT